MDPPDAPQPLPSARSKFDAVPHAQPSGASFALSAGTSAPACTLASACVAASCHQAPCRPPLADVRGRARCFLESTAPHQQPTTHAKPPATSEPCIRTYVAMHSCEQSPPFAEQPLKLLPAPGVWGCPPVELPAIEALWPPRPRGAASGKLNHISRGPSHLRWAARYWPVMFSVNRGLLCLASEGMGLPKMKRAKAKPLTSLKRPA